jgi:hypothetical protein
MAGEFEFEGELEGELSPIRKIYADAMMEHLGELAAEAETEQEAAEHFLPLIGMAASKLLPVVAKAVVPLARKALPRIAKAVTRVTPQLTRGIGKIARGLHRNPGTRRLLRAVPSVARRTVGSIARQAARGQRITPRTAVRTLARQTQRVLGSPRRRAMALRRHHLMDRRLHRRWGRGMVRPHGRPAAGTRHVWAGAPAASPGAPVQYVTPIAGTISPAYVPSMSAAARPVRPGSRAAAPATVGRPGVATPTGYVCPPCPSCGTSVVNPVAAPVPSYCPCCGQLLR